MTTKNWENIIFASWPLFHLYRTDKSFAWQIRAAFHPRWQSQSVTELKIPTKNKKKKKGNNSYSIGSFFPPEIHLAYGQKNHSYRWQLAAVVRVCMKEKTKPSATRWKLNPREREIDLGTALDEFLRILPVRITSDAYIGGRAGREMDRPSRKIRFSSRGSVASREESSSHREI